MAQDPREQGLPLLLVVPAEQQEAVSPWLDRHSPDWRTQGGLDGMVVVTTPDPHAWLALFDQVNHAGLELRFSGPTAVLADPAVPDRMDTSRLRRTAWWRRLLTAVASPWRR